MDILVRDFKIIQTEYGFDLVKLVKSRKVGEGTIKEPSGEEYLREVECGFGMSLERCFEKISHLTLLSNKEQVDTSKFLDEYKRILSEIREIVKLKNE